MEGDRSKSPSIPPVCASGAIAFRERGNGLVPTIQLILDGLREMIRNIEIRKRQVRNAPRSDSEKPQRA